MKKISIVGPLLIAGGLLALAPEAQAGEWVLQLEADGTSSAIVSNIPRGPYEAAEETGNFKFDWKTNRYTSDPPSNDIASASRGSAWGKSVKGSGTSEASGTVKVVWVWKPKPGEDKAGPVPPFIDFLVTAVAQAEAANEYSPEDPTVRAYRDPSGETGSASVSVPGAKNSTTSNSDGRWSAGASHLFHKKTNGESRVEGPSVTLNASASIKDGRQRLRYTGPPGTNYPWCVIPDPLVGYAQANSSAGATIDERSMYLSRTSGSTFKETVDDDGTRTSEGDTTYSFRSYDEYLTGENDVFGNPQKSFGWKDQDNRQIFRVSRSGNWHQPTYKWSPTTAEPVNDVNGGTDEQFNVQIMSKGEYEKFYGDWRKGDGGGGSPTLTIEYEITDDNGNGPSAKAKYILHLHHEWENWRSDPDIPTDRITQLLPNPVPRDAWFGDAEREVVGTWSISRDVSLEASVAFEGGFNIADALNFGVTIGGAISETVGEDQGIETTAPKNKMMFRAVEKSWIRQHYLADHYTSGGKHPNPNRADGAWPQSWNDTFSNRRTFGGPFSLGDFNMDGRVDVKDDEAP